MGDIKKLKNIVESSEGYVNCISVEKTEKKISQKNKYRFYQLKFSVAMKKIFVD